jgi:hypothetical protein
VCTAVVGCDTRELIGAHFGFFHPQGHVGVVRVLLAREGIDIDDECNGLTPLDTAKEQGHSEIVALLLEFLCNAPKY